MANLFRRNLIEVNTLQQSRLNFNVFQWNTFGSNYSKPNKVPKVPAKYLDFNYRKNLLSQEIKNFNADLIFLQEVDFSDIPFFKSMGRERIFYAIC